MSYIVRKINRAKWPDNSINTENISSDAITQCLFTKQNSISFWEIGSKDQFREIVITISSAFDHLDSFDVVVISKKAIVDSNIEYEPTPGITLYKDFEDSHIDLVDLTYGKLGYLAELVLDGIINDECHRITRGKMKKLLKDAIEEGLIAKDELSADIIKYLD